MAHGQAPHSIPWWYGVLLAAVVCMAGCTATPVTTPTPTTATTSAPTLVVWHALGGNDEYVYGAVIQAAAAKLGFSVVLQRMPLSSIRDDVTAAWQQGKGPHIAVLTDAQIRTIAQQGMALPLDAVVAAPVRERIPDALRATTQYTDASGHTGWYGVPIRYTLPVLFYNSRAVLRVPTTTEDLFTVARALHNPPEWGLGADISVDNYGGYLSAFDGSVFDSAGRVTLGSSGRAGAERWLTWLAAQNNDPDLLTRLNGVFLLERAVGAGQVAMVIDQSSRVDTYRRVWGDALAVAPLPALSDTGRAPTPFLQSTALVVNQRLTAAEVRATQALFDELLSPAVQLQLSGAGYQPVINGIAVPTSSTTAAIEAAARTAVATPPMLLRYDVHQSIQTAIRQVLAGVMSPVDAVTLADSHLRLAVEGTDLR